MTLFAPDEIIGVAYDSGGVTQAPSRSRWSRRWGVGLASSIKGRDPDAGRFRPDRIRQPYADDLRARLRHGDLMEFVTTLLETAFGTLFDVAPIIVVLFCPSGGVAPPGAQSGPNRAGFRVRPDGPYAVSGGAGGSSVPDWGNHGGSTHFRCVRRRVLRRRPMGRLSHCVRICGRRRFATTVAASPSLIAVSLKAEEVSAARGGRTRACESRWPWAWPPAWRWVACVLLPGTPLPWYIIGAYAVVIAQTFRSNRNIIPLA